MVDSVNADAEAANSKYAGIVVDTKTGNVLYSENADRLQYPASLTKMMTLYLTFEALEQGRIRLDTSVPFSAHASAQAPTKLGVRPGGTITVEQAVLGLVTLSANDASTALGELLAGTEDRFRAGDDGKGARARHDAHDLSQCQRPAEYRPDDDRARSGPPRYRTSPAFSAVLRLFLHAELQVRQPCHP